MKLQRQYTTSLCDDMSLVQIHRKADDTQLKRGRKKNKIKNRKEPGSCSLEIMIRPGSIFMRRHFCNRYCTLPSQQPNVQEPAKQYNITKGSLNVHQILRISLEITLHLQFIKSTFYRPVS